MTTVSLTTQNYWIDWSLWPFRASATPTQIRTSLDEIRDDYFSIFHRSVTKWRSETIYLSLVDEKLLHPAFQNLVALGDDAIDLILKEIETRPDLLYLALQIITGEDPVPASMKGDVRSAVDMWIEWGRRNRSRNRVN